MVNVFSYYTWHYPRSHLRDYQTPGHGDFLKIKIRTRQGYDNFIYIIFAVFMNIAPTNNQKNETLTKIQHEKTTQIINFNEFKGYWKIFFINYKLLHHSCLPLSTLEIVGLLLA